MAKTKQTQTRRFREFKEIVLEQLREDPEFAVAYLNESLKDEDQKDFLQSLRNVVEAYGGDISVEVPVKPQEVSSGKVLQAKKKK